LQVKTKKTPLQRITPGDERSAEVGDGWVDVVRRGRFCRTDRETRTTGYSKGWKKSTLPGVEAEQGVEIVITSPGVHDPETPRKPLPIKDKRSLRRVSMRDDEGEEDEDERA
jgi:hypothetical protein